MYEVIKRLLGKNSQGMFLLAPGEMSDAEYDLLKPEIEAIGGHWRERYKAFVFAADPMAAFGFVDSTNPFAPFEGTAEREWKEKNQFFETPPSVAKRAVGLCDIQADDIICEPSAGRGALLKQLPENVTATYVIEPDTANIPYLIDMGYSVIGNTFEDFMTYSPCGVTKIIMNPPFSGQRDVKHIMLAYELLEDGGTLVAIMSENGLYYDTPLSRDFNIFLKDIHAYVEPVPFHAFRESGTTVDTVIVRITKPIS